MSSKEKSVVITSALRSAIGSFNGSLKNMQEGNFILLKGAEVSLSTALETL